MYMYTYIYIYIDTLRDVRLGVGRQTVKVFAVSAFTVRCCLRQYGKGTSSSVAFRPFLSDGWKFPRLRLLPVYLYTCMLVYPVCLYNDCCL